MEKVFIQEEKKRIEKKRQVIWKNVGKCWKMSSGVGVRRQKNDIDFGTANIHVKEMKWNEKLSPHTFEILLSILSVVGSFEARGVIAWPRPARSYRHGRGCLVPHRARRGSRGVGSGHADGGKVSSEICNRKRNLVNNLLNHGVNSETSFGTRRKPDQRTLGADRHFSNFFCRFHLALPVVAWLLEMEMRWKAHQAELHIRRSKRLTFVASPWRFIKK